MTEKVAKIDDKQKEKLIEAILKDNPQIRGDALKSYYIEQLVESYLLDPDTFNRKTTEMMKQEKKKKGDVEVRKMPEEIVCISKVEAEQEGEGMKNVVVS